MCECVYVNLCVPHTRACVYGGQKRVIYSLELELAEVVSHLMWVLGTEPGSFTKAISAFNYVSAVSLPPSTAYYYKQLFGTITQSE